MLKRETGIKDCFVAFYDRYADDRGHFQELFNSEKYDIRLPMQANLSVSGENVLRGIHCSPFGKLCTVTSGKAFDVVVDLREDSPTYLNWVGEWLSPESKNQMFVPAGCGHGFFSAVKGTGFLYLQEGTYDKSKEREFSCLSSSFGIVWPSASEYIMSEKDRNAPVFIRGK